MYSWTTEDGQEVHTEQRYTVSKEHVMPGDSLTCTVTGVDANDGEIASSATVEYCNAPPEVSDVTVSLLRPVKPLFTTMIHWSVLEHFVTQKGKS